MGLLLVRHYGQLIAYGAGWTDPERQRPVGDTSAVYMEFG